MKKYILIYLISLILQGCDKHPEENNGMAGYDTSISISSGGVALIADYGNNITTENTFSNAYSNIQILRMDGNAIDFSQVSGVSATGSIASGSNKLIFTPTQYFNAHHHDVHYFAYYPAGVFQQGNPIRIEYTIDGTMDILSVKNPQTAVYEMIKNGSTVDFLFEHRLALIELRVIASDQSSADIYGKLLAASVKVPDQLILSINADGSCQLNKKSGSSLADISFSNVAMGVSPAYTSGYVMVYPDAGDLTRINLAFENRSAENYPVSLNLESGKKYVLTATVTAYSIRFSIEVEPWKEGNGGGNGTEIEIGVDAG